jgi:hypothetical protein
MLELALAFLASVALSAGTVQDGPVKAPAPGRTVGDSWTQWRGTSRDGMVADSSWPERERFGQYMSLVSDGRLILGLDQRGELILFKANPAKFELIGRRKVARQETWAHIAVAGDQLFVRELKAISCRRWAAGKD